MKKVTIMVSKENQKQYDYVMQTVQKIGNKNFAYIPTELLYVDASIQRDVKASQSKIKHLAANWNDNKMDALRVSAHPEECRFSVVNGMHRLNAAAIREIPYLICEIMELSTDPAERHIQEATLFATQNDEVDTLTPAEKHNANVIRGIRENVELQKLAEKYQIMLKKDAGRGRAKIGYLAGFAEALAVVRVDGTEMMDNIFRVICESRWNISTNGFATNVIRPLRTILKLHPEHINEIVNETVKFFKPMDPAQFFAEAMAAYPERSTKERMTLYLEDYLCKAIGMRRVYHEELEQKKTA